MISPPLEVLIDGDENVIVPCYEEPPSKVLEPEGHIVPFHEELSIIVGPEGHTVPLHEEPQIVKPIQKVFLPLIPRTVMPCWGYVRGDSSGSR